MVRGDARGRVVGDAVAVGHLQAAAPEVMDDPMGELVARHREPGAPAQGAGTGVGVGQGDQGMDHRPATVREEHVETDRTREMGDDRAIDRLDRGGHRADGAVRRRDHQQIDALPVDIAGRGPHVVAATHRGEHPPTSLRQGSSH